MHKRDLIECYHNLEQAFAQLGGMAQFDPGVNLRLERMTHLLALLGNPQHAYPSIHIGGTSGKGSTAAMVAAMLTAAGYRTGLHLSPHLQILNEGYQINGHLCPTSRLAELFAAIKPAIARVAAENPAGAPTAFEAQVALAFYLFQQEAVDLAVVEVGMGGTRDATNLLPATVAVLTSIGMDHTAILGDTVAAITREKAGIIKPGQRVVSGVQQPEAQQIIADRCAAQGATLWQIEREVTWTHAHTGGFTLHVPTRTLTGLTPGMPGEVQIANAACAIAALELLPGFTISETAIRQGLHTARLPGRMEVIQTDPVVLLDGAHNLDKLRAAIQFVDTHYTAKRRIVVLALKADKDARALLPLLAARADQFIVTAFRGKHQWEPLDPHALGTLAAQLSPNLNIHIIPDPVQALKLALTSATPADLIWITGSLYLVGDVREHWYPTATLLTQAEEHA